MCLFCIYNKDNCYIKGKVTGNRKTLPMLHAHTYAYIARARASSARIRVPSLVPRPAKNGLGTRLTRTVLPYVRVRRRRAQTGHIKFKGRSTSRTRISDPNCLKNNIPWTIISAMDNGPTQLTIILCILQVAIYHN